MPTDAKFELAKNIKRIGHLDLPGGGQVVVQGNYAYVGHMKPPHGTTIIDVSDPARPKVAATIELPNNDSHTHKARVAGDLLFVNVEQNQRHFMRKGAHIPELRATLEKELGRPASDAEVAARLGVGEADVPVLPASAASLSSACCFAARTSKKRRQNC